MVLKTKAWIRYCFTHSHYLILSFLLTACLPKISDTSSAISIQWEDSLATGVIIPMKLFTGVPEDSIKFLFSLHLIQDIPQPPVFGDFIVRGNAVIFEPLVPFTRGLSYDIRFRDESVGQFKIPFSTFKNRAEVLSIYPTHDSVPLNLLKVYIAFSKPMREADVLNHVFFLREKDTLRDVFLDLQPALWNREGTVVTLWLDPGRIKRDLQPNRKIGTPLKNGEQYQLVIKNDWQATDGSTLEASIRKDLIVSLRDSTSPNPDHWTINAPGSGTLDPLTIQLHESLDYVLLMEAFDIHDPAGKKIPVNITITNNEKVLLIRPVNKWKTGAYSIRIESRLEDLAGNNLNRLFDRDITMDRSGRDKDYFDLKFHIK